jgi:hypothetical protein
LFFREKDAYFVMDEALDVLLANSRYTPFRFDYEPTTVHTKAYKLAELEVYWQAAQNMRAR